ncbi:MAG TPA: phosphoribosylglycinamide formyltransferase [Pseudomonadales bacterium]|nr:phosphoribosylglycinamide formyltransferase [Pseudomonadales bacterium]
MRRKKLVILISGSGSNLQAFIDAVAAGTLHADIACVISNKPGVFGLERASKANIETAVLEHKSFATREDYDHALLALVEKFQPDLVVLAGFMRILTPVFVTPLYGKLINIHPSLLPKYPGLHTHQRAIDAGDKEAGVTVHFVSAELDAGPAIMQASVPVLAGDDANTLGQRVLAREHKIYPLVAQWLCEGRLHCDGETASLDGKPLPQSGIRYP